MQQDQIAAAQAGDRAAQEQFVEVYYGYVMGFLLKICLDYELAQDLTQETFIKALRSLPSWRGDAAVGSWLIAIAHNLYKDHLRASSKWQKVPLDSVPLSDLGSIDSDVQLSLKAQEALSQLALLPADRRDMVVLHYYYGYTSKEIAKMLRIPEGTVRSRLHYAIKQMSSEEG